jgi:hypothetical protein
MGALATLALSVALAVAGQPTAGWSQALHLEPADNPDAWKIFNVYVGETGLPLNRPKTTGD